MKRRLIAFTTAAFLAMSIAVGGFVLPAHAASGPTPYTLGCGWSSYDHEAAWGGPSSQPQSLYMTVDIYELRNSSGQYCGSVEDKACFKMVTSAYASGVVIFNSMDVDSQNVLLDAHTTITAPVPYQWYCVYSPVYAAQREVVAYPLFRSASNAFIGQPIAQVPLPA